MSWLFDRYWRCREMVPGKWQKHRHNWVITEQCGICLRVGHMDEGIINSTWGRSFLGMSLVQWIETQVLRVLKNGRRNLISSRASCVSLWSLYFAIHPWRATEDLAWSQHLCVSISSHPILTSKLSHTLILWYTDDWHWSEAKDSHSTHATNLTRPGVHVVIIRLLLCYDALVLLICLGLGKTFDSQRLEAGP